MPIAVLRFALYRATAGFPERRLQLQISMLVQLLGSIILAAIVTYSIYVIEHAQQAEEKRAEDQKIAADNKTRVLHFIKDELSYDLAALKGRNGDIAKIQQQPLKSDFWRIAGLSGDLTRTTPTLGNGLAASIRGRGRGEIQSGTAATFDDARAEFGSAWAVFLANRTDADFQAWRY